jgi:hypothetical protein
VHCKIERLATFSEPHERIDSWSRSLTIDKRNLPFLNALYSLARLQLLITTSNALYQTSRPPRTSPRPILGSELLGLPSATPRRQGRLWKLWRTAFLRGRLSSFLLFCRQFIFVSVVRLVHSLYASEKRYRTLSNDGKSPTVVGHSNFAPRWGQRRRPWCNGGFVVQGR